MTTFAVLAHREPLLLSRLVERLAPHDVVVHVDGKSRARDFRLATEHCGPRVRFVPDPSRVSVNWAGFSMLRATMAAYREALRSTHDGEHIVLLSGQDYPIKPLHEFQQHLQNAPHRQHIRMFQITPALGKYYRHLAGLYNQDLHLPGRLDHPQARRVLMRLLRDTTGRMDRKAPEGTIFTFGSQWVALTRECVQWIVEGFPTSPVARYTARSFAPDEKTIHSMVANSPYAKEMPGGAPQRFIGEGTYRMANFHEIDPSLNKIFTLSDLGRLSASDKFFVRKVSLENSSPLLDAIDATLVATH
ncbi:hypothetical protein KIH74_11105 [Kineosporia sp. J2-2]|uniref:Peptide O-xylosyltransferase n=1 Tax=Kineosporia corallincola TaxID=2835133 RepID=A0ABS5TEH7_9ACTN|nr:beta-1,6-N-acetylglucosaminyltransferase [Kineosporia corallincola]MBT0769471.1 hypothetical protein [Kineosporia corallincola]